MRLKRLPSQEELRSVFDYDPTTGTLSWKWREDVPKDWNTKYAGREISAKDPSGYFALTYRGEKYSAHRIIFKMMLNEEPEQVDHRDLDRGNNRIDNLRSADNSKNGCNKPGKSKYGKGVTVEMGYRKPWRAQIQYKGKKYTSHHLTKEEAQAAVEVLRIRHHGDFASN